MRAIHHRQLHSHTLISFRVEPNVLLRDAARDTFSVDFAEQDQEVGVRAGGGVMEAHSRLAADFEVGIEGWGFEDEDVGACGESGVGFTAAGEVVEEQGMGH